MDRNANKLLEAYPLETLLQTIPTGLFLVSNDLEIVYWNAEAERITGYSSEDAVGSHCSFLEGIPCDQKCGLFEPSISKPVTGVICSVKHKKGHRVELTKNVDLLRDSNGEIVGGIEAFVDISRQKELEKTLRRGADELRQAVKERTRELELEKSNLRAVLDGMSDFAYICTGDFRISFMNQAMREVYGDVVGDYCYEALHQIKEPCDDCPIPQVQDGHIIQQERRLGHTGRTYEIIHSPLKQGDQPVQKLGVCRDITERKLAAEKLRLANRELDAFVATVSHDLRSPLTPLIGFAEFLQEQYAESLEKTGLECLAEIERTGRKMQALLEDLLTLARVGQIERPSRPVSATRVVNEVVMELAVEIMKKNAKISIGELPSVRVPESLLLDLFRNLISNALNYAAPTDPHIEIFGSCQKGICQLGVRDHGPGIPESEREEIFEPFQRGSSSEGKPGTGIGLATIRKIARIYSGRAWVEETPGGGSTFMIEILDEG